MGNIVDKFSNYSDSKNLFGNAFLIIFAVSVALTAYNAYLQIKINKQLIKDNGI
jgi:hypothetical protein